MAHPFCGCALRAARGQSLHEHMIAEFFVGRSAQDDSYWADYNRSMNLFMTRGRLAAGAGLGALLVMAAAVAAQNVAVVADPAPDKEHPAAMVSFQLPSHGALLNALMYVAAGAGPHPTVVLLHGFPGNERNLDLAQSIRRAGWDVLFFDYRGSWGSPGDFSFTHCLEDTEAAIAWVRDAGNAARVRSDGKTVVLVGHSMGGFMALEAGARDPSVTAVVTISAADLGTGLLQAVPAAQRAVALQAVARGLAAEGMAPLAGTSPEALAEEVLSHATEWSFGGLAAGLATRPLLVITSDDGLRAVDESLVEAVRQAGSHAVSTLHLATDHAYSDRRITLQEAVVGELAGLGRK
jgi:pimeloyl-ACP methyl ester carboxylesterase